MGTTDAGYISQIKVSRQMLRLEFVEGRGFIEILVDVPLPDGGTEVKDEYYCISMFHQLHCIVSSPLLSSPFSCASKYLANFSI